MTIIYALLFTMFLVGLVVFSVSVVFAGIRQIAIEREIAHAHAPAELRAGKYSLA